MGQGREERPRLLRVQGGGWVNTRVQLKREFRRRQELVGDLADKVLSEGRMAHELRQAQAAAFHKAKPWWRKAWQWLKRRKA